MYWLSFILFVFALMIITGFAAWVYLDHQYEKNGEYNDENFDCIAKDSRERKI